MRSFLKLILIILFAAGVYYGCEMFFNEEETSDVSTEVIRPVKTITLSQLSGSKTKRYFGTLQGAKHTQLSFRVSGTLSRIAVEKGARVKKGDLLAVLDPRDFQTNLRQAQSSLSAAQAELEEAQINFRRYENLYKQRAIPRAEYDTNKKQLSVCEANLKNAQAQVKSSQDALRDTQLRAPFDGIITDRAVENFQDIEAKQTIFYLHDISSLEIVFNIPDSDVLYIPSSSVPAKNLKDFMENHKGFYSINAKFDSIKNRVFPLELKEFSAQSDPLSNTYSVTAEMKSQQDLEILPGLAVNVEINFPANNFNDDNERIFLVPSSAVFSDGSDGGNFVWKIQDNNSTYKVSKIHVNIGHIHDDSGIEISSTELNDGDLIAVAGVSYLREGQKVKILQ